MAWQRSVLLVAAALTPLLPSKTSAQWLYPGQSIRVTAPQRRVQRQSGQLEWLDADSVVILGSAGRRVIPRELLTAVDSLRGTHGHAMVGLAAGAVVGFVVGAALLSPESSGCNGSGNYGETCSMSRIGIVVGSAGLGALVGALIRTDQWAPVAMDSLRFGPAR
jgi:hypothetical protein